MIELTTELDRLDAFHREKRSVIERQLAAAEDKQREEAMKLEEAARAERLAEAGAEAVELLNASRDADRAAAALVAALVRRRDHGRRIRQLAPDHARHIGNRLEHRSVLNGILHFHGIGTFCDVARNGGGECLGDVDQRLVGGLIPEKRTARR